jgi:hypothetical protein
MMNFLQIRNEAKTQNLIRDNYLFKQNTLYSKN